MRVDKILIMPRFLISSARTHTTTIVLFFSVSTISVGAHSKRWRDWAANPEGNRTALIHRRIQRAEEGAYCMPRRQTRDTPANSGCSVRICNQARLSGTPASITLAQNWSRSSRLPETKRPSCVSHFERRAARSAKAYVCGNDRTLDRFPGP